MMTRLKNFCIGLCACIVATTASAEIYTEPLSDQYLSKGMFLFAPELRYIKSTRNYDIDGTAYAPLTLDGYSRLGPELKFSYGAFESLSVYAKISWMKIDVDRSTATDTIFGFTDQIIGTTARLYKQKAKGKIPAFFVDGQFQIDFPLYSNSASRENGVPFLGDGSADFTGALFLGLNLNPTQKSTWLLLAGSGLTLRTAGYASHVPWSFSVKNQPENAGVYALVGAFGNLSIKNDGVGHVATTPITASGGSQFIGAQNPSSSSLQGRLGYHFDRDRSFYAGISQSVWGRSAPAALTLFAGLELQIPASRKTRIERKEYTEDFKGYSLEAKVSRVNDRFNLIKIDKGSSVGVEVGQTFDIFAVRKNGSLGDVVARTRVTSVKSDEAALEVEEYYWEIWIEEGFVAKRQIE